MATKTKSKTGGNIFETLNAIKSKIMEDKMTYSSPEYNLLFKAIDDYLRSNKWAHNDTERMIYIYSGKGMTTANIADVLGINVNSYRSAVSRLSSRLRDLMFNGEDVYELILNSDIEVITSVRRNIEFLNMSFDLYKELSTSLMKKLTEYAVKGDANEDFSDMDYYQVILFLSSFCEDIVRYRISLLNPSAVAHVLDELGSMKASNSLTHYNFMKAHAFSPKTISEHNIGVMNDMTGGHR